MTLPGPSASETAAETPVPIPGALEALEDEDPGAARAAPVRPRSRREPLHFVVLVLLVADVIFGLGLAVFAEQVLAFRPMAVMGVGLAALGLGILGYFVLFGGGRR